MGKSYRYAEDDAKPNRHSLMRQIENAAKRAPRIDPDTYQAISSLKVESLIAGDTSIARDCDRALQGNTDAIERCLEAIDNARAMTGRSEVGIGINASR